MPMQKQQRSRSLRRNDDEMSDASMDQAYGQRVRGSWEINKTVSISVIIALFAWTVSGVWFAAQQSAALQSDHTAISELQADQKDNDKQRVEILLHLSNMDQSLKDILNYGLPRSNPTQVLMPSSGASPGSTQIIMPGATAPTGRMSAQPAN
jgi:hypothetical protein